MAIHNDYPGLTVQIICGGKPIEEHVYEEDEEREEPKTTTRYIECKSHTQFAIETTFRPPFTPLDLSVVIYLDGVKVGGTTARKHKMLNQTYTRSTTEWKEGGEWRASKFVFSDLNVVQEESEVLAEENLDALGTISVAITPILSVRKKREYRGRKKELKEFGMISEETVKGDHYRGSSDGLEGLSEKDLAILLSSYRGDKPDDTPIKQEPVFSRRRVGIKRESVGDSVARGQGKKRKMEIIVLDD
ncbi:unnamed protein product [Alternaria sp. RS040]